MNKVVDINLVCWSTCLSYSAKPLWISSFTEVSYSGFIIHSLLMLGYSLKVLLFGVCLHNNGDYHPCRFQWPRGLRRRSSAARLLRLWVRIPPGAWMFDRCVLSGRGLCYELITCPDESYRLWCVVVCDLETSWMRRPWPTVGLSRQKQTKANKPPLTCVYVMLVLSFRVMRLW